MKPIQIAVRILAFVSLAVLAAGCAGNLLDKQNVAAKAGFKTITPTKQDQQELLRKLPEDKVTRINYEGKEYYVLPDAENNQAYVGGPKQYEEYVKLRKIQEKNSSKFKVAPDPNELDPMESRNAQNWSAWGGWGRWGGPGGYGWY